MNLYKEYKENILQQQREKEDRERIGLPDAVIIYEENHLTKKLRYAGKCLLFGMGLVLFILLISYISTLLAT